MNRQQLVTMMVIVVAAGLMAQPALAQADDPAAQCAEGLQLLLGGQHAEALPLLEAGFAGREEATFSDPDDLGICALALGVLRYNTGNRTGALDAYAVALEVFQNTGNWLFEGTTLHNIGAVYNDQGRYREALASYREALVILRKVGDRAGEGTTLNDIGVVYDCQGHYGEALASYQEALTIWQEVGSRTDEGTTLNNIGLVYDHQGRYGEALDYCQQALAIAREVGDRAGEGTMLNNIGLVYHAQGRYGEALASYREALVILREVGSRTDEGDTLHNIGAVYRAQGRYGEALANYQEALAIAREVGDRAGEGTTLHNIGAVYDHQGRYGEALASYQEALAIAREVGDRAGEGASLNNIGAVHDDQGRYAEALASYQQALVIMREVGNRTGEGTTLHNIGAVYDHQGRYGEALASYQEALAIAREVGNRAGEGTMLNNIGFVYQQQSQPAQALTTYEQAMDIVELVRAVAGSEAGRAGFIAQYAGLYNRTVWLHHQQGQDDKAFIISERGRARAFLDSLATGYTELTDNVAADLLAQEQETYAYRQAVQDDLAKAHALNPPDPSLVADLEAQLTEAEAAYAKSLADIEARGDQLAALVPGRSTVLALSDVQPLLDEETTLISYFILEDDTLAFLITQDSFHTVALNVTKEELFTQVRAFRDFPSLDVARPDSTVTLYGCLIEPLREYLTTPHLAIVPHGVLHYLPFAALTDGQRYLVDDYIITYLPSASALPFIKENAIGRTPEPLTVLGNPATDDPDLPPLLFAERESQKVAELYDTQPLLNAAATESAVRESASQAGILHLSAHGSYNRYNPLYSAIALAPDEKNDGLLEVHEVYSLDLSRADLVVLSACETQLGKVNTGDEVVGLNRAFLYAGTPSVIASLWSVDDEATALLMEHFYTYLREGVGTAEALRQAQLDVRAEYPNPYYWSAFVLTGDPGVGQPGVSAEAVAAEPEPQVQWFWIGGIAVALLVVAGGIWLWRRK